MDLSLDYAAKSDHWPIVCSSTLEEPAQKTYEEKVKCTIDWKPSPQWFLELELTWDLSQPGEVLQQWQELAEKHKEPALE